MDYTTYLTGAQPFYLQGGKTGILLLHGLAASPAEMRWLGEHLAGQGFTVHGVRSAGHGVDYRALRRIRWQDWYASALDGYHLLRANCERVIIVGHSTGGTLGLLLASDERFQIEGIAALAAPVMFESRVMANIKWFKPFMPYTNQADKSPLNDLIRSEQARRGEPVLGRVRYDIWAVNAGQQLYELCDVTRPRLANIHQPMLAIYARHDKTVAYKNLEIITSTVKSASIEVHTLEKSGHILPQDVERDTAFELVTNFAHSLT